MELVFVNMNEFILFFCVYGCWRSDVFILFFCINNFEVFCSVMIIDDVWLVNVLRGRLFCFGYVICYFYCVVYDVIIR